MCTLCHGKLEKVMENHGVLKAQKSTNDVARVRVCGPIQSSLIVLNLAVSFYVPQDPADVATLVELKVLSDLFIPLVPSFKSDKGNIASTNASTIQDSVVQSPIKLANQGPVVRKPINANPPLKINRGFHLGH